MRFEVKKIRNVFVVLDNDTGKHYGRYASTEEAQKFADSKNANPPSPLPVSQLWLHTIARNGDELDLALANGYEPYAANNNNFYLKKKRTGP